MARLIFSIALLLVNGIRPAVGGNKPFRGGETAGLVTEIHEKAFIILAGKKAAEELKPQQGITVGDKVWVTDEALVHILTTKRDQITIKGPAIFEFSKDRNIRIYEGSFQIKSGDHHEGIGFETVYVAGVISGESMVWTSQKKDLKRTQVLCVSGLTKVWHPYLPRSAIFVPRGHFTESSAKYMHLQPKPAKLAKQDRIKEFFSRFHAKGYERLYQVALSGHLERKKTGHSLTRGSRSSSEVVEKTRGGLNQLLSAKVVGKEFSEDVDPAPILAPGGTQNSKHRNVASAKTRPGFEISKEGSRLDEEQKEFLKVLKGRQEKH